MNNEEDYDEETTINTIRNMFNKNKICDLKKFMDKRSCINWSNQYLTYLFYFMQTAGVFSTSIGNAYKYDIMIWSGVGLNSLASFIYIVINSNSKINNTLLSNIKNIKSNNYIDEGGIEFDKKSLSAPTPQAITPAPRKNESVPFSMTTIHKQPKMEDNVVIDIKNTTEI